MQIEAETKEIMSLADVLPAQPGDGDYIDSDNGQCCCGEYQCEEGYVHWTSLMLPMTKR